jgi:hypothetical protein
MRALGLYCVLLVLCLLAYPAKPRKISAFSVDEESEAEGDIGVSSEVNDTEERCDHFEPDCGQPEPYCDHATDQWAHCREEGSAEMDEEGYQCGDEEIQMSEVGLVFDPPQLDFVGVQALLPTVLDFTVINHNPSTSSDPITIFDVITNNIQFHTVTFQQQVLYYQDSLSVHIMFLPYFVDRVETDVVISTSLGDVYFHITGHAVANPYHLHPFIGYRIPAGEQVYQQPISIFNPHDEVLSIREIFTTESFLSLQYPSKNSGNSLNSVGNVGSANANDDLSVGNVVNSPAPNKKHGLTGQLALQGPGSEALSSWIVPPGVEKEVMLLSMSAKLPGTYSGYVHIVCDRAKFVVPVELIALEGGIKLEPESIDFGVLTELNEERTQEVFIVNSGATPIRILDVVTDFPDPQLQVIRYFDGVEFGPSGEPILIAAVAYTAADPGHTVNKLIITTNAPNPVNALLSVSIVVHVLHGGIGFNQSDALFFVPINNVTFYQYSADQTEEIDEPESCGAPTGELHPFLQAQLTASTLNNVGPVTAISRQFSLINYFPTSVLVHKLELVSCGQFFELEPIKNKFFEKPCESMGTWPPLRMRFNKLLAINALAENPNLVPFTCYLEIQSNVSTHHIPLTVVDAAIKIPFLDTVRKI